MTRAGLVVALLAALVPALPEPARSSGVLSIVARNSRGAAVAPATVTVDGRPVPVDEEGRAWVESGSKIEVSAPAYLPASFDWDGATKRATVTLAERPVFAVHVTGSQAGSDAEWQAMVDRAATSSLNALMVDLKDESGRVYSATLSGRARELGAEFELYDLAERSSQAHESGLYLITRIVTFQDPLVGRSQPTWSAWDTRTGAPFTNNGQVFLDPWDAEARRYALDLAADACAMGADEVQFDYVRFPDHSKDGIAFDGPIGPADRQAAITSFLAEAASRLHPAGCAVAADIFGFIVSVPHEGGIGQQLEELATVADVLSPMVYPSHYVSGWFGFSDPNSHPYAVVSGALSDGLARLTDSDAVLRPWIQDFYYTADQVRAEIDAADDHGVGWMLWNVLGSYHFEAIPDYLATADRRSTVTTEPLPASGFYDVPDAHPFAADITWLAGARITTGCNQYGDEFCPDQPVTRAQMAAFLTRLLGLHRSEDSRFVDAEDSPFARDIAAIEAAGITAGCNPPANDRFCPGDRVTRGQMAALLARALSLGPSDRDYFSDDEASVFQEDINRLATAQITFGTSPTEFSPGRSVTRAQMAAFLHRASR